MRIRDILQEKGTAVVTIDTGRSLHEAIGMLNRLRIGALIVTEESEHVVGIITERDVLQKCGDYCDRLKESVTQKESCFSSPVQDTMTKKLVIGALDDDPDYVMGVMTKNRIRHLPIIDDGKLAGIISIGDLVNAHLEEKVLESQTLKNYLSRNSKAASAQKDKNKVGKPKSLDH
jgi:CBS domain-containing protein